MHAALDVLPAGEVWLPGQEVQEAAPAEEYVLAPHCAHEAEVLPALVL